MGGLMLFMHFSDARSFLTLSVDAFNPKRVRSHVDKIRNAAIKAAYLYLYY